MPSAKGSKEGGNQIVWCSFDAEDSRRKEDNIRVYLNSAATRHMLDNDSELAHFIPSTRTEMRDKKTEVGHVSRGNHGYLTSD